MNVIFDTIAASLFQTMQIILGNLVVLLTVGIFTLLGKKLFQLLTLLILYKNWVYKKYQNLTSEMLTPCHGGHIKFPQITYTLLFCITMPFIFLATYNTKATCNFAPLSSAASVLTLTK